VLAEALALGGIGAALGALTGIAGALALSPFLDDLTGHRNPVLVLDIPILIVASVMGVGAALIAALAPAWSAARMPVLAALSGRRPPISSGRRSLGLGIVLVVVGVALTATGAALRISDERSVSVLFLLAGAVLGTLGFGSSGPWLLAQLERLAGRAPLASRIALRDTARARSRNGPIVTALLAATAATIALAGYQTSVEAANHATFRPFLLPDQVYLQGPGAVQAGPLAARDLHATAGAVIPGAGSEGTLVWVAPGKSSDPNDPLSSQNVTVGDEAVLQALGAGEAEADFNAGKVIVLTLKPAALTSVTIHITNTADNSTTSHLVPARIVVLGTSSDLPGAIIPAGLATKLGVPTGHANRYVLRLGHPVTDAEVTQAGAIAGQFPDTFADTGRVPDTAGSGFRIVLILGSLLFALSVTGIAVALGEAESRPEQRTLLAVGADPRLRRRITAARAGIIALMGGLLAVPAGLLPVWGLLASRKAALVVPGPEVAVVVLLLPVLAVAATWLLSRPIPDWSAFREQRS
jgi:putative ABC transport system permease protein